MKPSTTIERRTLEDPAEPGRNLRVRIERPVEGASSAGPLPFAVLLHGFKGFMDWGFFPYLSRRFAEAGFVAVSVNTSGCGVGDDPLVMDDDEAFYLDTYGRQLEDIGRARAFARALPGVDPTNEVLFGHSRGGGMAVLAAADDPPRALVTWAAIDSADRWDEATKRQWRAEGVLHVPNARTGQVHRMSINMLHEYEAAPQRFDIAASAARITVPWLVLHGSDDATVASSAAQRLAESASGATLRLVEGGDHGFGAVHPLEDPESRPVLMDAVATTLGFASG